MSNRAWVTLATNDSYGLGALVLAYSLRRAETSYPAVVLITPAVTESMKNRLGTVFAEVITVDVLDSHDAAHLALLQRPELGITFTKIHCWSLTQYEKCVFLDADTLIVQNCDELFEREELSAAPDVGWPDCFNSGVFVYQPSQETFNSLIKFAQDHGSFDGGDQGLLNSFFSDWAQGDIRKHLPFLYNVTSAAFYSYLPALKHFGSDLKIIHFIGSAKPWLQTYDWQSGSVNAPTHLQDNLQLWWNIFVSSVHPQLEESMVGYRSATSVNEGTNAPKEEVTNYYRPGYDPESSFPWHKVNENREREKLAEHVALDVTTFFDPWENYGGTIPPKESQDAFQDIQVNNGRVELSQQFKEYVWEHSAPERHGSRYENHNYQPPEDSYRHDAHNVYQNHCFPNSHSQYQEHTHYADHNQQHHEQYIANNENHNYHQEHEHSRCDLTQLRVDVGKHQNLEESPYLVTIDTEGNMHQRQSATLRSDRKNKRRLNPIDIFCYMNGDSENLHLHEEIDEFRPRHPYDDFYLRHRPTIDSRGRRVCFHQIPPTPPPSPPIRSGLYNIQEELEEVFEDAIDCESGVAGNLARVAPGEVTHQHEAINELNRRQGWEAGNIDYMGADSFDNIWAKISKTLNKSGPELTKSPSPPKESSQSSELTPPELPPKQPSPPKEPLPKQPSPVKDPSPPVKSTPSVEAKQEPTALLEDGVKGLVLDTKQTVSNEEIAKPETGDIPTQKVASTSVIKKNVEKTKEERKVPVTPPVTPKSTPESATTPVSEVLPTLDTPISLVEPQKTATVEIVEVHKTKEASTNQTSPSLIEDTTSIKDTTTPPVTASQAPLVDVNPPSSLPGIETPEKALQASGVSTDSPPLANTPSKEEIPPSPAKSGTARRGMARLQLSAVVGAAPLTPDSEAEDAATLAQRIIASELASPTVTAASPPAPISPRAPSLPQHLSVDESSLPTPPAGPVSLAQIGVKPTSIAAQIESSVSQKMKESNAPVPPPRKKEKKPKSK